jgi:hypothetical protein
LKLPTQQRPQRWKRRSRPAARINVGLDRSSIISIAVRHGGLHGRIWSSAGSRLVRQRKASDEDVVEVDATASLDDLEAQLVDHVIALCAPLFRVFDFAEVDRSIYEQIVNNFVAGRIT